jgi:signal transduction histidine kinase
VRGDSVQLQQVLLNLVINASEAMEGRTAGSRTLTARSEAEASGGVVVSVADQGRGIAPDKLELIFEPFYTTKDGGLGLGLSISRSIIEAHGGRLWCRNSSDRGSASRYPCIRLGDGGNATNPLICSMAARSSRSVNGLRRNAIAPRRTASACKRSALS